MVLKFTTTAKGGEYVKVIVYGPSGNGKTRLAGTAPKPVIISSEKKLISLKEHNIPVILIETLGDFEKAHTFVTGPKGARFETVVVDSISDIAETILVNMKENPVDGNKDPRAAYGQLADQLGMMIKKFRDISDKHIYFIAKSKMIEDSYTNVNMFTPSLPGKVLTNNIAYEFDYVFAMRTGETESGKKYRYLQTQPDLQWTAKGHDSLNVIERPNLANIFKKLTNQKIKEKKEVESNKEAQSDQEAEKINEEKEIHQETKDSTESEEFETKE